MVQIVSEPVGVEVERNEASEHGARSTLEVIDLVFTSSGLEVDIRDVEAALDPKCRLRLG